MPAVVLESRSKEGRLTTAALETAPVSAKNKLIFSATMDEHLFMPTDVTLVRAMQTEGRQEQV